MRKGEPMKNKIDREFNKIKKAANRNLPLTIAGTVGGALLLFIVLKAFISLLPVFALVVVALIAYKLYKKGFFG